jgi:hypothetical protein
VTHDDRSRAIPLAIADVKIRVAYAARRHPHENFARPGWIELEILHSDWVTGLLNDDGTHQTSLASRRFGDGGCTFMGALEDSGSCQ